ncbi:MAG: alpha-2-macroglobulin family protein [Gemmataceae bacterium]
MPPPGPAGAGGALLAPKTIEFRAGAPETAKMPRSGMEKTDAAKADSGPGAEPARLREYFPETLLWQPSLITDDHGRATLELSLADSITTWRLTASGSSRAGRLGGVSAPLRVFQDFFVDLDLPVALTRGDEVAFPVAVYNYLKTPQTVTLTLKREPWFDLIDDAGPTRKLDLEQGQVTSVRFRIKARKVGTFPLTVEARGAKLSDAVKRSVEVLPDGERVEQVFADRLQGTVKHKVTVPPTAIEDASKLFVKVYPGVLSQVVEGLEGMLQMPTGCFEQTSSSAYPNILVVDYIKRSRLASPALLARAETFLSAGYQRLLTFERPGGGFDWWGSGEPLVWLSAYGLQEFHDMARVHPIDRGVIDRTQAWLMRQQEADGTWSKIGGTHGESIERMGDPKLLLTSYVAWSLLDSMPKPDGWRKSPEGVKLSKAIAYVRDHAPRAENPYVLALAANALAAWDAKDDSTFDAVKKLLARLDGMQERKPDWDAVFFPAKGQSLSYGRDDALVVETTALAVLAMVKHGGFTNSVNKALTYLIKTKGAQGHWGSTQATILALKAMTAGLGGTPPKGAIPYAVLVNGKRVADGEVTEKNADVLQLFDLTRHLAVGDNEVSIEVKGETSLTYQVVARHFEPRRERPAPEKPTLAVGVEYDRTKLSTNDLLRAKATLRYNGKSPTYNVIVDLPIPPGFTVDAGDFAELVAERKVQRFSVTARQVILYLGDVSPGSEHSFAYSLKPKYPIKAEAAAAVAYEYYTPTNRAETKPVELVVEEKK